MRNRISSKATTTGRGVFSDKQGFALIITISLLTFLILVLFAMTTLTRVETRMAGSTQQMSVARENAKMALNVAIGQLQRHAGPDDRVTARADIDDTNDNNPYWTGVWDANTGSLNTWLVSGNEDPFQATIFDPTPNLQRTKDPFPNVTNMHPKPTLWPAGTERQYLRIVGKNSTGENDSNVPDGEDPLHPMPSVATDKLPGGVVVPKVPIFSRHFPGLPENGTNPYIVGSYAYWVADEGVKASVGLAERHLEFIDANASSTYSDEDVRRLRQLTSQRFWFEGDTPRFRILEGYPQFDLLSNTTTATGDENEWLTNVMHFSQVRSALSNISEDDFKDRFHDVTGINYGVLAATDGTGLKLDLSYTGSSAHADYRRFLEGGYNDLVSVTPNAGVALYTPVATSTALSDGDPAYFVAPVVSEAVFRFGLWQDSTGELQVSSGAEVELWNPYTVDLDLNNSSFVVRLTNLEPVVVQHNFDPAYSEEVDLEDSAVNYVILDAAAIGVNRLAAGEVLHVTIPSVTKPAMNGGAAVPAPPTTPPATNPTLTAQLTIETANATPLEAEVWLFPSASVGPWASAGALDTDIAGLGVEPVGRIIPDSFDPLPATTYDADDDTVKFGFNFRVLDSVDDPAWLTYYDPRTIGLQGTMNGIPAISSVTAMDAAHLEVLDGTSSLLDANTAANRVKIFELPIQEQVSLGALQHLYIHNEPAYALGNNWSPSAGIVNTVFDHYFLSTIPQGGGALTGTFGDFPLPNPRLVSFDGNPSVNERSAENMMVKGMFNVNSTSINAWRSVLSAINIRLDAGGSNFDPDSTLSGEWEYAGRVPADKNLLTSAIFRFSQTAHLTSFSYQNRTTIEASPGQAMAYQQGVRQLTEEQVYALAYEIVEQLRINKVPFVSLSAFVEAGVIQKAIDIVDLGPLSSGNPIPAANANINGSILPYSPAFITQGDIITALAPYILTRSDTFLVRAYGDAQNPATGKVESRAYCEAIVQRVPTPFDPSETNIMAPSGQFGRKFEIVYFRWLTPGEI